MKRLPHEWDDDGLCIHCYFDGAEDWSINHQLKLAIGNDEFKYRLEQGEFDAGRFCPIRYEKKLQEKLHDKLHDI